MTIDEKYLELRKISVNRKNNRYLFTYLENRTKSPLGYTSCCLKEEISHKMCLIFQETLPIWLPIRCPLRKNFVCLVKSLKNMPESLETMTDSVRLRPLL